MLDGSTTNHTTDRSRLRPLTTDLCFFGSVGGKLYVRPG